MDLGVRPPNISFARQRRCKPLTLLFSLFLSVFSVTGTQEERRHLGETVAVTRGCSHLGWKRSWRHSLIDRLGAARGSAHSLNGSSECQGCRSTLRGRRATSDEGDSATNVGADEATARAYGADYGGRDIAGRGPTDASRGGYDHGKPGTARHSRGGAQGCVTIYATDGPCDGARYVLDRGGHGQRVARHRGGGGED